MKRLILLASILACLQASVQINAQDLPPYSSELIWQDEFDLDTLDVAKWTPLVGDGCNINLCGWGNNEGQWYTGRTENVRIENGRLVIEPRRETIGEREYSSARLITKNKGDFRYARVEASIKVPKGRGLWSAFWMLSTYDVYGGWPKSGEIDIMEFLGKARNQSIAAVHYGPNWPDNKFLSRVRFLESGSYYDTTHLYAVEWHPYEVKWFIDSVEFFSISPGSLYPERWPFDQDFHLILNTAVGGNLGGTVDNTIFPTQMEVEYVRVHSYTYLEGKKNVFKGDTVTYKLMGDALGSDYVWSIPEAAELISGNGTSAIDVAWNGSEAGAISLQYTKGGDTINHQYLVKMQSTDCEIVFDDFDGNKNVEYIWWAGRFTEKVENTAQDSINPSDSVAVFRTFNRNRTDMITMKNIPIYDVRGLEKGEWNFYLDVYSDVPAGSKFQIVLENEEKIQSNFPNGGARSIFSAKTTLSGKWETLLFQLEDLIDTTIAPEAINQLKLIVDIGEGGVKEFLLDNFEAKRILATKISGQEIVTCNAEETYTVDGLGGTSFQWTVPDSAEIISGQGTNQITVKWGSIDGNVTVKQMNDSLCEGISGRLFVTTCPTGISSKQSPLLSVVVYPNPVNDQLIIDGLNNNATTTVRITNIFGVEMKSATVLSDKGNSIDVSGLSSGIYHIQLMQKGFAHTVQFYKN